MSFTEPDPAAEAREDSRPEEGHTDGGEPQADPVEPAEPPVTEPEVGSHRGAFGEFGGETGGLIERTFRERILVVGVILPSGSETETETDLDELELLVDTAGADVVGRVVQRRQSPDPATYVGSGKVDEIRELAEAVDCDTVVFDDELTPGQQSTLTKKLGRTALDRTAVILDIFAQNAHTLEGKAQVELAQLRYRLPRLRGRGIGLSQQEGRIGTRGPGETQLEIDRRRLVRRIQKLESELKEIGRHRRVQRSARQRTGMFQVAIVGYTNAGKSTLLNRLTDAGVLVEDRLFATLDATTRRFELDGGESVVCTDTVGFVRKLPHQLVEAFTATLEVVTEADLLVHVVDGSGPDPDANIAAVRQVLGEIGAAAVPELLVFNKADRGPGADRMVGLHPGSIAISAVTGQGVDVLLAELTKRARAGYEHLELLIPWDRGDVLAAVHRSGEVSSEVSEETGMRVTARLRPDAARRFAEFGVGADTGLGAGGRR